MRPIKAVIFDIDDTIFDMKTRTFIPSSLQAMKQLQKNGYQVILATGRPLTTARAINDQGVYPQYIICVNGSLIVDDRENVLLKKTFSSQLCESIYQYCQENDIGLVMKYSRNTYEYIHKDVFEKFYNKTPTSRSLVVFDDKKHHFEEEPFGGCLGCDREKMNEFNQKFSDFCHAVAIDDFSSDLILNGVSKKSGLQFLLERLNISPEQCMSFGDNDNDLEINDYVGIGVAVGDCSENLRNHADYITDSMHNDGVMKALQHFGLIK